MSEATFFVFLFHLFSISPFYHKCNPSPPLRNYKRGGRGHIKEGDLTKKTYTPHRDLMKTTHIPHKDNTSYATPTKRPGICSLSRKLITPTTSTLVQGNTSNSQIH
jgi:hypothetical protein